MLPRVCSRLAQAATVEEVACSPTALLVCVRESPPPLQGTFKWINDSAGLGSKLSKLKLHSQIIILKWQTINQPEVKPYKHSICSGRELGFPLLMRRNISVVSRHIYHSLTLTLIHKPAWKFCPVIKIYQRIVIFSIWFWRRSFKTQTQYTSKFVLTVQINF